MGEGPFSWLLCTSSSGWSSDLPSRACWYTRCVPRARASSIHRDSERDCLKTLGDEDSLVPRRPTRFCFEPSLLYVPATVETLLNSLIR